MKNYIGVKLLKAKPMSLGEYNKYRGWTIPADEDPNREGYLVQYDNEYQSWSPKEVFEKAYFEIENDNKLCQQDIDRFVDAGGVAVSKLGEKTTVAQFHMPTGWEDVQTSSCIDPANYDESLGLKYCLENVKHNIWKHLGFVLQWAVSGLKR